MGTTMNKALILFFLTFVCFSFKSLDSKNNKVEIDTNKSTIEWTGKKLTGEHYGNITIRKGHLLIKGNTLVGGAFDIDMNTITCVDITDAKSNARLVDHLKSDDFFAVRKYPIARFEITQADFRGDNNYIITGNLTIKDKTNGITFPATFDMGDSGVAAASGNIVFDRSKYNVKFGSQSFFENLGDKMVYDDVDLKASIFLQN